MFCSHLLLANHLTVISTDRAGSCGGLGRNPGSGANKKMRSLLSGSSVLGQGEPRLFWKVLLGSASLPVTRPLPQARKTEAG